MEDKDTEKATSNGDVQQERDERVPLQRGSFDELLSSLGEFGRYQRRVYFFLFLPTIFSAMHKLAWVFLGGQADHRCLLPDEDAATAMFADKTPLKWGKSSGIRESCDYSDANGTQQHHCNLGYVYDRSTFGSSAVMEFSLVCSSKSLRATAQSIFMVGVLLGSVGFGDLSDRMGRKPVFVASVVLQTIFGLLSGLAPEYWSFVLMRLVVGMTTSGVFLVSYVLAMEMVGSSKRVLAGTLCQYYYTFGFFLMGLMAYFLNHDWRMLQFALTLPTVVFVSYWWFMPESVRWMIGKGKYEEAAKQVKKVAEENGSSITSAEIDQFIQVAKEEHKRAQEEKQQSSANLLTLFSTPNLRCKTLNLFFAWLVNSGTYYGLSLGSADLVPGGDNPYFKFLLSAAVEIPAYLINLALLNQPRVGRRLSLSGLMLLAGAALFATVAVDAEVYPNVVLALSLLGKLAITASYGVVYIFATEQFPTQVRNVGLGGCSMSARIGGILCPYVNLLQDLWGPLPLLIYGSLAVVGGLLSLLLPETLGKRLPETIEDGENFGLMKSDEKTDEVQT